MGSGQTPISRNDCVKAFLNSRGHALRKYQRVVIDEVTKLVGEGGVIVAELPTGYGKTLIPVTLAASLVTDNIVSRVIHTYPATSMIEHLLKKDNPELEALRRAWIEALGIGERAGKLLVGARHMFRHESPLLTNPYVVTTLDTLVAHYLKTTFAKLSRASSKGVYSEFSAGVIHSSLLVFDEAHMYPVITEGNDGLTLGKAFNVMAHIMGKHAEVGGVSLFMTATLPEPLLHGLKEVLARYGVTPKIIKYDESQDDPQDKEGSFLSNVSKRSYDVKLKEVQSREELIEELTKHAAKLARKGKKVLAVLNTVGDAVEAYVRIKKMLGNTVPVVLAHSRFTVSDRKSIVEKIKEAAKSGKGSVVVATQVVEASIDISMDALLTDVAPLDSIAQRLGRVCRPGHISSNNKDTKNKNNCDGFVKIYASTSSLKKGKNLYGPYNVDLIKASLRILKDLCKDGKKKFSKFAITPREWISKAYEEAYAPVLLPNDKLLDFLEELTVRTSPALIEEWAYEEFGGFVREKEDLAVTVLAKQALINTYLKEKGVARDELGNAVHDSVEKGRLIKIKLSILINILKEVGIDKVPIAWVSLKNVFLSKASVEYQGLLKIASRGGAYIVIPEELYDSELGLKDPRFGEVVSK